MSKRSYIISLICILSCAVLLIDSRSAYAPYLIATVYALYCLYRNLTNGYGNTGKGRIAVLVVSFISSVFITLANYGIWLHPLLPDERTPMFVRIYKALLILVIMSGTFFSVFHILIHTVKDTKAFALCKSTEDRKHTYRWFVIPFAVLLCIYLAIYFSCYYPGLLSPDSLDQVGQLLSGNYSNHQPFYHTMLIGLFLRPGFALSHSMNTAVAFYVIFQVVFMAATFAFAVYNMAELNAPVPALVITTAWFALMPYHIMYSFTVWKDVYFGAFSALLVIFLIRIDKGIGKEAVNTVGFAVCSVIICLIRSNGLFAYVFVFASVILLMRKHKKLIITMAVTIVATFILKHSVLTALNVTQPDTVESLSIPLQQVARVVADDGIMTDEDRGLLSKIIDISTIADIYNPDISDPVKNAIRDYGNQDYLTANLVAFGGLYFRTLLNNPMTYVCAWVDSTCGYWNGGYDYWVWYWDVESNPYGITRVIGNENVLHFMDEYLWLFYNNRILRIFTATGLFVWILLLMLAKNIAASDKTGIVSTVPVLAILLSLVISSPVYAEFRYLYPLFTSLPVIIAVTCRDREGERE